MRGQLDTGAALHVLLGWMVHGGDGWKVGNGVFLAGPLPQGGWAELRRGRGYQAAGYPLVQARHILLPHTLKPNHYVQ